jgi:acyl-coenzyme A synthetase/AMP-(fatty) acid ligase
LKGNDFREISWFGTVYALFVEEVHCEFSAVKWLRDATFVAQIPKPPTGKILRRVLGEQAQACFHA